MANNRSAEKRVRQSAKRTLRNRAVKSSVKTAIKKVRTAVDTGSEDVLKLYNAAVSAIDKAAAKGVIHKNAAARRKSRLARKLTQAG